MRTKIVAILMTAMLAVSGVAQAQDAAMRDSLEARAKSGLSRVEEMLKIIKLPGQADVAREAGVPDEDVKVILEESIRSKLPPAETEVILQESATSVRENGPVDNFGAFVQMKLNEGLRGRDLAAAIHEEHRLRGKGKGHGKDQLKGKGQLKDKGRVKDANPETIRDGSVVRDPGHGEDDHDETEDRGERKKKEKGEGK